MAGSHERSFSITAITWSRSIPGLFDEVWKWLSGSARNEPFKQVSVVNMRESFLKRNKSNDPVYLLDDQHELLGGFERIGWSRCLMKPSGEVECQFKNRSFVVEDSIIIGNACLDNGQGGWTMFISERETEQDEPNSWIEERFGDHRHRFLPLADGLHCPERLRICFREETVSFVQQRRHLEAEHEIGQVKIRYETRRLRSNLFHCIERQKWHWEFLWEGNVRSDLSISPARAGEPKDRHLAHLRKVDHCMRSRIHQHRMKRFVDLSFVRIYLPQAICDTSEPISSKTFLGRSSSLVELCPSCPWAPDPNEKTPPSTVNTTECFSPQAA